MRARVSLAIALTIWGGLMLAVLWLSAPGSTQPSVTSGQVDPRLQTILKGMQTNYEGIRTARGQFRIVIAVNPQWASEVPYPSGMQRVWWATEGKSFREETSQEEGGPADRLRGLEIAATDGNTGYVLHPMLNSGSIVDLANVPKSLVMSNISGWLGLSYRYALSTGESSSAGPLWEQIGKSGASVRGEVDLDGLKCFQVEAVPDSTWAKRTWWIAPSKGYCIRRIERVRARNDGTPGNRSTIETLSFHSGEGGYWLASSQEITFDKGGTDDWAAKWKLVADDLSINCTLDAGIFRIQFPLSASVISTKP